MPASTHIAVVGLGYVGLPLALALSEHFPTMGYDLNASRIKALKQHHDHTREVCTQQLATSDVQLTDNSHDLADANVFIITVPTPVDSNHTPDLSPLLAASETIGGLLKKGDVVIYESTVYPGATEGICADTLQNASGLRLNKDFFLGYSPERINPGDKVNTLQTIVKVVAGSTPETAERINQIYQKIIPAGTHMAPTIQVAEAAKAIENTQRDINIAFMNELSMMFHEMDIDVLDVIAAASTKWNFLPFKPGLVGGHCIGVDPYYLIHQSQQSGYFPQLITTARRLNENMSGYVSERILKLMALHSKHIVKARILIMGVTFKENCPDLRNTRVVEIKDQLERYHAQVDVCDPWADAANLEQEYGIALTQKPQADRYDLVLLAVAHDCFKEKNFSPRHFCAEDGLVFDLKGLLPKSEVDARL
ncbi:nucleotide sugar dehydrogenase [Marinicella gelatinilytica]|uniref:nucleotide sugar dehydrogenase n=1 Tax=Marinicella gelatinilytica TaxID=2996017 RepID=UPI002260AB75|nr:nucleotide sugar dehydrogenase [Marinicella gelatinilytica]MCX7545596.1 nucleotide sugar dehydrogenase [Marinicella gelatinilytica]